MSTLKYLVGLLLLTKIGDIIHIYLDDSKCELNTEGYISSAYRGRQDTSASGYECQKWTSQQPRP